MPSSGRGSLGASRRRDRSSRAAARKRRERRCAAGGLGIGIGIGIVRGEPATGAQAHRPAATASVGRDPGLVGARARVRRLQPRGIGHPVAGRDPYPPDAAGGRAARAGRGAPVPAALSRTRWSVRSLPPARAGRASLRFGSGDCRDAVSRRVPSVEGDRLRIGSARPAKAPCCPMTSAPVGCGRETRRPADLRRLFGVACTGETAALGRATEGRARTRGGRPDRRRGRLLRGSAPPDPDLQRLSLLRGPVPHVARDLACPAVRGRGRRSGTTLGKPCWGPPVSAISLAGLPQDAASRPAAGTARPPARTQGGRPGMSAPLRLHRDGDGPGSPSGPRPKSGRKRPGRPGVGHWRPTG